MNAPTPPRDALVRDRDGRVWHCLYSISEWVTLGPPSQESGRSYTWPALLDEHGPLDVLVWRHTAHRSAGESS